jgi:hypothetical protein
MSGIPTDPSAATAVHQRQMLQILMGPKEELPGVEFHEDASVGVALRVTQGDRSVSDD